MAATPYPLQWPAGRPRKALSARRHGKFLTRGVNNSRQPVTISDALTRLEDELDRIQARYPVISTNVQPRLDGRPRSGQGEPSDPGVAVYFQLSGKPVCLPCDTYHRVADNIAAIAAHIEASRLQERHGVATVAETFAGFTALPAPSGRESDWWILLGVEPTATMAEIDEKWRTLAAFHHPDKPTGSQKMMAILNNARDRARAEKEAANA